MVEIKLLLLLLTIFLIGLSFCNLSPEPPSNPNVILITIDTLRADHLSSWGYRRQTSPFIDTLSRRGIRFTNCYATSSWTAPSMASIFTSLYPSNHGVRHGIGNQEVQSVLNQELLDPKFQTLAETLRAHGYSTFGISSNMHISEESGMAQGFDRFFSLGFTEAPLVHEVALSLKDMLKKKVPFFLWLHYFDPHSPYKARKPWIGFYGKNKNLLEKWSEETLQQSGIHPNRGEVMEDGEILGALTDLYDSEINFTDYYIKKLFDEVLPKEKSLIILTSDHGEAFLDHGVLGHTKSLFNEEVRVPLLILPPDNSFQAKTINIPVSINDIYPTIIAYLNLKVPTSLDGCNLFDFMDKSGNEREERNIYCELDRGSRWRGVVSGQWKYMQGIARYEQSGKPIPHDQRRWLFNLSIDPRETKNMLDGNASLAQCLDEKIKQWQKVSSNYKAPRKNIQLTYEQEERLKSLGYLQ